jgi:hypothetical protein
MPTIFLKKTTIDIDILLLVFPSNFTLHFDICFMMHCNGKEISIPHKRRRFL